MNEPVIHGFTLRRSLRSSDISPVVLDTLRDSWTACRATSQILTTKTQWRLGAASTIIAALTGTTVFATVSTNPAVWARCVVGAAALLVALMTALQTWYSKQREALKKSMDQLHELHQEIETAIYNVQHGKALPKGFEAAVKKRYDGIDVAGIPTAGRPWRDAANEVEKIMWQQFGVGGPPAGRKENGAVT